MVKAIANAAVSIATCQQMRGRATGPCALGVRTAVAVSVTAAVRADRSIIGVNAGSASFMLCRGQDFVSIAQVCRQRMEC